MFNLNTTTSKLGSAVSNLYFYPILYLKLSLLDTENVYTELSYYAYKTKRARLWFRVHRFFGEGKEDKTPFFLDYQKALVSTPSKQERDGC